MIHNKIQLATVLLTSSLLFIGCSGGGGSDASTPLSSTEISGQLVDNFVENADYKCEDASYGVTDANGSFTCARLPVTFSLGGLQLGKILSMPADKQIFPQDLLGLDRNDTKHKDVAAMAVLLQSCDDDKNPSNGLRISQQIKDSFIREESFDADNLNLYALDADVDLIDENDATEHLDNTVALNDALSEAIDDLPPIIIDAILTPQSLLTQELKNTLSYMGNEERLAYDVYNKLYETYPEMIQFTNIATNGERPHIKAVQLLIQKYIQDPIEFTNIDLIELNYKNTMIENMQAGTYDISAIQSLYDTLIAKGVQSAQDALEVGCIIEVTDINDLDVDIQLAQDSQASDILTTFEFLRDGSYSHYWAFDQGLKTMGVTDGCCVLGSIDGTNFCHPEYPQNENGAQDHNNESSSTQDAQGKQYGKNR
ncbi:MAG: hypothetical protein ACI9TV_000047 [Sulfurimonas sp.]|jgi:hypothetical protein|uniref:DUF2202 domain-containing protein n=1 Tax=Sulfurimonas sp. TaxID=2022749 RepID=UPI0039E55DAF